MSVRSLTRPIEMMVIKNAPVILTGIGVAGVVSVAYMTGKATFRAAELIRETEERLPLDEDVLTSKDKLKLVWTLYLPAAGVASSTIAAIVMANRISMRRGAAMAAAYMLSEKRASEYKDKVLEELGINKESKVQDAVAQKRVDDNPLPSQGSQIIVAGEGKVPCFDVYNGRWFESTMEDLKKAQNDCNYLITNVGYCSLAEFYSHLGLPGGKMADNLGWDTDNFINLDIRTTMTDHDRPAFSVDFVDAPFPNFYKVHR